MSNYYHYSFISPEPIFSIIQEEFKSYFDTGAIDSLMFNTYLNKCLEKLGRGTYSIVPEILYIENFEARLPDNFRAIREAWYCTEIPLNPYQTANSFYSQTSSTTIQIEPLTIGGVDCNYTINCPSDLCPDMPEIEQTVYKTNQQQARSFRKEFLLSPGNLAAKNFVDCPYTTVDPYYASNRLSPHSASYNSFDIRDNKLVVTFREGTVYILMYVYDYDVEGNQLIPDNYRIKQYIEDFIKYKMFETLTNQVNDETFNQLQQKMIFYKQQADESFIMANLELQKQDAWTKTRRLKQQLNKFNMYELSSRTNRYGWRRNS